MSVGYWSWKQSNSCEGVMHSLSGILQPEVNEEWRLSSWSCSASQVCTPKLTLLEFQLILCYVIGCIWIKCLINSRKSPTMLVALSITLIM